MNWKATKSDYTMAADIARRAVAIHQKHETLNQFQSADLQRTIMMDMIATHVNGCPLKLRELLSAAPFDFTHDVFGIYRHLDRESGQLRDCFLPRYADLSADTSASQL